MPRMERHDANIGLYAFSSKSVLQYSQYEVDMNKFRDPIHKFRTLDGRNKEVQEWIKADKRMEMITRVIDLLIADQLGDQKSQWISIGFRDYHGRWISAAVVELLSEYLSDKGFKVFTLHQWLRDGEAK